MARPSPSPSRADEVWRRLVGLFGGDAVARKFGDKPPEEWVGVIAQLNDYQLTRGMARLVASGRAHVPTLPEFRKLCVEVRNDDIDRPAVPALPPHDDRVWDQWDIAGNKHLLAHIARQAEKGIHYCSRADMEFPGVWRGKDWRADGQSRLLTGYLVAYKNAWVRDMREAMFPTEAQQRAAWADCMARADAEVNACRE